MDAILQQLLRQLDGEAADIVKGLLAAGPSAALTVRQLQMLLIRAIANAADRALILRFLVAAARAGLLPAEITLEFIASSEAMAALLAAQDAALVEAGVLAPAAAGGAGEAAGAGAAGASSALGPGLFLGGSLLFLLYQIASEYRDTYVPGGSGIPCAVGTKDGEYMRRVRRSVTAFGSGQKSALNRALRYAEQACQTDKKKCSAGKCASGKTCKPDVAVDEVDIFSFVVATRVKIWFTCPCVCN